MKHSRNVLAALVVSAFFIGSTQASVDYSQKTYLSTRPHGVNTAMEYTTWHEHAYKMKDRSLRANVQATGFYMRSQESGDLGKYFGIGNGRNSFVIGRLPAAANTDNADIENGLIIHDFQGGNAANRTLKGTVNFNPRQEAFGFRLDWFQDITHPFDKLYFKASAPVVHVSNNIRMTIPDSRATGDTATAAGAGPVVGTTNFSLIDFFNGNVSVLAPATNRNLQSPLTKAKIAGRRSATGLADLDLALGYKYLYDEKKHVFISLDVTIPTGNRVRGTYLFEPICGNGRHFGLGGSIDSGIQLWRSEKATLRLLGVARYKYLFENTEQRTVGIKGFRFSEFFLLGTNGVTGPLTPAANVLTLPIAVKPGHMFDASGIFAFNSNGFTIDAGYNFFWRDQETVHLKSGFQDNVFGIASSNFDTTGAFGAAPADFLTNTTLLTTANLDLAPVKTPALLTHKIFAGLGYTAHMYKKYPISFGIGGSYEFATSNADLENYAAWAKLAFSV